LREAYGACVSVISLEPFFKGEKLPPKGVIIPAPLASMGPLQNGTLTRVFLFLEKRI